MSIKAYGAYSCDAPLEEMTFIRRKPGVKDIQIEIIYCGVCHSDLHTVRSEWQGTLYPCVPGHEIIGRISAMGEEVTSFKIDDIVGVGCMVDSCQSCCSCNSGDEQYCEHGFKLTYNSPCEDPPGHTLGGYSQRIVVDEKFVLRVRHSTEQLAAAAPLLCAGITTYSPLRHWNAGPGKKIGIVGIGGLGHMGIKFSHALGAYTVAFTTSENKRLDAKKLGADEVIVTKNSDEAKKHIGSFDFILDTAGSSHDLNYYTALLKRDGVLCLVGLPENPHPSPDVGPLIFGRKSIAGSLIGSIRETQEMLDFCADKGITCDVELIPIQKINESYERMLSSDVKYRFVIDMASLKN